MQGDGFDLVKDLGFWCGFCFFEESSGACEKGDVDVCEGAGGKDPFSECWVAEGDDFADFENEVGVYLANCMLVKCLLSLSSFLITIAHLLKYS